MPASHPCYVFVCSGRSEAACTGTALSLGYTDGLQEELHGQRVPFGIPLSACDQLFGQGVPSSSSSSSCVQLGRCSWGSLAHVPISLSVRPGHFSRAAGGLSMSGLSGLAHSRQRLI